MPYTNYVDQKAAQKRYYERNKSRLRTGLFARKQAHIQAMKDLVNTIKTGPCTDCGQTFHPHVMDFDHINDDKTDNISSLVTHGDSEYKIMQEIAKCELVCCNCHRMRTYNRRQDDRRI